jgi:23S rRNA (cytosine1962-C5)-methyltransferase
VDVYASDNTFLGSGHYQIGSICVRILTFTPREVNDAYWVQSLQEAYRVRQTLGLTDNLQTTAYRLVHGECDFLPGLIIDIYGSTAVMQAHSAGMFKARQEIADALQKIYGNKLAAIYDKSAATAPFKAGLELKDDYLFRQKNVIHTNCISENGNKFLVDWESGQKTGFFLDQRDNRTLLGRYAKNKQVLNLFCYTGGFSVYALAGGAAAIHSVDSSQRAIDLAAHNINLNNISAVPHETFATDAFEFLRNSNVHKYDLMILDPPAFAKHTGALRNALQAYKRLNAAAFEKIAPNGIIFTFSCSQVVNRTDFRHAVFSAATIARRKVRILHQLTQPADHPVNIFFPEGEYLKGLVLHVE